MPTDTIEVHLEGAVWRLHIGGKDRQVEALQLINSLKTPAHFDLCNAHNWLR